MSPRKVRFDAWKRRPGRPTLVALLEAAQGRVFAICRDILRHREEAEEAAQETLLKIVEGIDQVTDAEHFERWVGMVATRTAIDRQRSLQRRRVRELAGTTLARDSSSPVDGLQDALSRLPDEDRSLLVERYFERRTLEEMADRRGVSDVAVRKRIAKAQDRLKRLLGGVVIWGMGVVKAKAAIAAVVLALLFVGGGAWMATDRRGSPIAAVSKGPVEGPVVSEVQPMPPAPVSVEVPPPDQPLDHARLKATLIASWNRLRYAKARSAECRRIWPDSTTEEELRRLVNEKAQLDVEIQALHRLLPELAARDPGTLIDLVRYERGLEERLRLLGLVAPDVAAELHSEETPGGPLLSAILTLAAGDAEEKTYFAAFASRLSCGNRDIGKNLVSFLQDPDFHVRYHSSLALESMASQGVLREFMTEQIPTLQQVVLRQGELLDERVRATALRVLARMESDAADDFILHQLEGVGSGRDFYRLQAAEIAAPRLAKHHEARLTMALVRALECCPEGHSYWGILQVAASLPEHARATVANAASLWRPEPERVSIPLASSSHWMKGIPRRKLLGIDRFEPDPLSSEPMLRNHPR